MRLTLSILCALVAYYFLAVTSPAYVNKASYTTGGLVASVVVVSGFFYVLSFITKSDAVPLAYAAVGFAFLAHLVGPIFLAALKFMSLTLGHNVTTIER